MKLAVAPSREPIYRAAERLTTLAVAGSALVTLAVSLGACSSVRAAPHFVITPAFSGYWVAGPRDSGCPAGVECVASRTSWENFQKLRDEQRERGLDIVDFDAQITSLATVYAGAWATSDSEQEHELEKDLSWNKFDREHERLSQAGYRLISLKVYEDHGRQRIAAIWSPRRRSSTVATGFGSWQRNRS